jgi:hypothetical protein
MPVEGFKSITVSEEVFDKLQKLAEKNHRTVPGTIQHLLETSAEA